MELHKKSLTTDRGRQQAENTGGKYRRNICRAGQKICPETACNRKQQGRNRRRRQSGCSRLLLAMTDFCPHATLPTADFSTSFTRSLRSHSRLVPGCVTFSVNGDFTRPVNRLQLRSRELLPAPDQTVAALPERLQCSGSRHIRPAQPTF